MVGEMAEARRVAVLPKLALEFHRLGPTAVSMAVRNVGPGAALMIDVRLIWEPSHEAARIESRWRRNVVASGERFDFLPPGTLDGNINSLPADYRAVRLVGTMRDATGHEYSVDERFDDLADWRESLGEIHQRFVHEDVEKRLAEELHKKFKGSLSDLARGLREFSSVVAAAASEDEQSNEED